MKQYALLLAGGNGKRLWPLSRQNTPKQFITLPNGKTLLETTLDRIQPLHSLQQIIVTTQHYASRAQTIAQKYAATCYVEPENRNTAPAIAWSLRELQKYNEDAVVVIMPTDHTITNITAFHQAISYAIDYATTHDSLVLCGAPQHYITTRFGFVLYDEQNVFSHNHLFSLHPIKKFHEKPTPAQAEQYYRQKHISWNIGIFIARASFLWKLFLNHAPEIIEHLDNYALISPQSFDHAVVEKSIQHLAILPYDFGWNDIGSLSAFIPALHDNAKKYHEIMGAHNNSITANKSVVMVGASDLLVIEMNDMIFIAQRNAVESPEFIPENMLRLGLEDFL